MKVFLDPATAVNRLKQPQESSNKPKNEHSGNVYVTSSNGNKALENYGKYIAFKGINSAAVNFGQKDTPVAKKLDKLRKEMQKQDLDLLIVRSTDDYLNETVDKNQSQRIYISEFTGSEGDVVISPDKAHLIVDGRYHTQADKEVDLKQYKVEKAGLGPDGKPVNEYPYSRMVKVLTEYSKEFKKPVKVGYDPNKFSLALLRILKSDLQQAGANVEFKPTSENLVDKIRGGRPADKIQPVRFIPLELSGETPENKINRLRERLKDDNIDAMVVSNLVDISYLTNLRGKDIDYSSVFKAKAFITQDKAFLFCNPDKITPGIKKQLKDAVEFKPESDFEKVIKETTRSSKEPMRIAYSIGTTTDATYKKLEESAKNARFVELNDNPVAWMRAIKNDNELKSMQDAMNRADRAVADVIEWVNEKIKQGEKITEKDLEDEVRKAHFRHGANDLSFEIIPASGANGAIVHYNNGDPDKVIKAGELVLLDTGGYYDGGYATDLTRTWLAGGDMAVKLLEETDPDDLKRKREIFSTVLLGALKGLTAELPPDADGVYLDKLVMGTIQDRGYERKHSTGHGIGIVVHESPPSISSSTRGQYKLQENMVFSIEPGIYIEEENGKPLGGVRIENLVTVAKHRDTEKAKEGWHEIKVLTFAPIDQNLIDEAIFTKEKHLLDWLNNYYNEAVKENLEVKDS
jgi:Xaa-Pro aminopeptidase